MRANKIAAVILATIILSSCSSQKIYVENSFFDKAFLKEQLVENLPEPWGIPLLYAKANGMNNPTSYIDASLVSSDYSAFYSGDLFRYLKDSFGCLYAIVGTSKYSTPSISKYAYKIEEANEIAEFSTTSFYSSQSQIDCHAFVYSKDGFLENEAGDKYLSNPHCIVITREGSYYFSYNKKTINYTYSVIFDTHSSFWLSEDWLFNEK